MSDAFFETLRGKKARRLRRALQTGTDPNQRHSSGSTPLYIAAAHGTFEKVRLLLEAGADANAESMAESEGTPLCAAACWGDIELTTELLRYGADPNKLEGEHAVIPRSALTWAAGNGHVNVVRLLLEAGADPNLQSAEGWTPLMAAAQRGSVAVTRLLLEHGASPDARDDKGKTALAVAERWAGKDLEKEMLIWLDQSAPEVTEVVVRRSPLSDGTELVEVNPREKGRELGGPVLQTGHAEIARMLRGS